MAFLKMGIYGDAGSGKTFTSANIAVGLHALIKSDKPVFFFDTETGSDFVREKIEVGTGLKLQVAKTRSFADLIAGLDEVPEGAILILDSITHYWTELVESYKKKFNLTRISLPHWMPLKAMWGEFTTRYVSSKLHIILCGRSADVWSEEEDETGAKELKKTGTKMRTETQMAYEPSLLVEMELFQQIAKAGAPLIHRAFVKKDRFDILTGAQMINPGFADFLPHIEKLNLGGEHVALEAGGDSAALFADNNLGERRAIRREILTEKIENAIRKLYPGQSVDEKQKRMAVFEDTFGTNSWTEISRLVPLDKLELGLAVLEDKIMAAAEELIAADAVKDKAAKDQEKMVPAVPSPSNDKPKKGVKHGTVA
jgi:hypothetical protein